MPKAFQTVGTGLPDGPAVQGNGIGLERRMRAMFLLGCRGDYQSPVIQCCIVTEIPAKS